MAIKAAPTKSNLMSLKKSLELAKLGYDLLDKKRNIIMREMMKLIGDVGDLQNQLNEVYEAAYRALQNANMTLGQIEVFRIAVSKDVEDCITVRYRSVMGIEIPEVVVSAPNAMPGYGLDTTNAKLDEAFMAFSRAKALSIKAAATKNSVFRLATAVKQSQKRANALKNIVIPQYEENIRFISSYLEEKERDEFTTLKVIKSAKQ